MSSRHALDRAGKLALYRNIVKEAKRFPSIKRDRLVEEIRINFRENASLTDQAEIDKRLAVAIKGLSQLTMYTGLNPNARSWTINLEQEPMPRPQKRDP